MPQAQCCYFWQYLVADRLRLDFLDPWLFSFLISSSQLHFLSGSWPLCLISVRKKEVLNNVILIYSNSCPSRGPYLIAATFTEAKEFCIWIMLLVLGKTGLEGNAAGWLAGILGQHRSRQETAIVATHFNCD